MAGCSGATLFGQPAVGPRDGVAFRVGMQGQVLGVESLGRGGLLDLLQLLEVNIVISLR